MLNQGEYLCSDLIRLKLSTGDEVIGHLETISAAGCTVTLESPVPAACIVAIQCLDCPKGNPACFACKMVGAVASQNADPPLGLATAIEFVDGSWCPERWKPRHLFACAH